MERNQTGQTSLKLAVWDLFQSFTIKPWNHQQHISDLPSASP